MMRSESTSAFGQPSETKLTLGAACFALRGWHAERELMAFAGLGNPSAGVGRPNRLWCNRVSTDSAYLVMGRQK